MSNSPPKRNICRPATVQHSEQKNSRGRVRFDGVITALKAMDKEEFKHDGINMNETNVEMSEMQYQINLMKSRINALRR